MAASLLTSESLVLENLPELADVDTAVAILSELGVGVGRAVPGEIHLTASAVPASEVPMESASRMRASILFMGPLLARTGRAVLPKPGGDDIGMRRFEQHVYGLVQMGASVEEKNGTLTCTCNGRLRGAEIQLDIPTVTGTENLMMAAAIAEGRTTISNAAREPHVQDLGRALLAMGAKISGVGTDRIRIEGVEELHGARHRVIPDYLEAGTYAMAAAATGGDVLLEECPVGDLRFLVGKLRQAGVTVTLTETTMRIQRDGPLHPVDLITWTHPGFATDLQPQFTALMTQANGLAVIQEFLFENRFQYVGELLALGASIEVFAHGRGIRVYGPRRLRGAHIRVPDIRAGAALLIAALCAEGASALTGVEHLDRGYEAMTGKLSGLRASIRDIS